MSRLLNSIHDPHFFRLARLTWLGFAALTLFLDLVAIPIGFQRTMEICTSSTCDDFSLVTPAGLERLHAAGLSLEFFAAFMVGLGIVSLLVYAGVALVIFWRRSDDPLALFGSFSLLVFGSVAFGTLGVLGDKPNPWFHPAAFVNVVGQIVFAVFFFIFPDGHFVPRWSGLLVLGWSVMWLPGLFMPGYSPTNSTVGGLGFLLFIVALAGSQIYRYYRVSNRIQKQQTKWVVLGLAGGLGGFMTVIIITMAMPWLEQDNPPAAMLANTLIYGSMLLIPLSFAFAILRSRLWDIDIIIRRTLIYGLLTVLLALLYFGSITLLQQLLSTVSGQRSDLAIIVSTLVIAALFVPLRNRVQTAIDHRFYRRKYNSAQVLATFAATARDEVDLAHLADELQMVVEETMQPEHISLWLRPGNIKEKRRPQ